MARAYGGVSAEDRRAQRRAALLAAGLDIIGTHGFGRLTVGGLCAAAGLNERYFYESFTTLDQVLAGVFDEVVATVTAAIVDAVAAAPDDARAKARAAIGAAVELVTDDPRMSRILFAEAVTTPTLSARRGETARAFVTLMVEQATEFYGAQARLLAGPMGELTAAYMFGGIAEALMAWLRGDVAMTREELIDSCTELFVTLGEHVAP